MQQLQRDARRTFDWRDFTRRAEVHREKTDLARAVTAYETAIEFCDDEVALADLYARLGEVHEGRGELDAAIASYKEALFLDRAHQRWLGVASALRRLGSAYHRSGDFDWAEQSFKEAEQTLRRVDDDGERVELYLQIGSLHEEQGRFKSAEEEYRQALQLSMVLGDTPRIARSKRYLGSVLRELGQLPAALDQLNSARELVEGNKIEDKLELIEIYNLLGATLEDQGRGTDALLQYKRARDLSVAIDHLPGKAASLRRMGSAYAVRGEFVQALECYEGAIQISRYLDDETHLSDLFAHVGEVYEEQGDLDRAIEAYNQALYLDRKHGHEIGIAGALRRMGSAYQERGQDDRAQDCYAEAEALLKRCDDEVELAILYINWGRLYQERGKLFKARELYESSLSINKAKSNLVGVAVCHRHLGSVTIELGDPDGAIASLESARRIHEEIGGEDKPELIEISLLLGAAEHDRGNSDQALTYLTRAVEQARLLNHPTLRAEGLRRLGMVYAQRGEYSRSRECYEEALQISRDLSDNVALSDLYVQLGELHATQGDLDEAVDAYQLALDLDQSHRDKPGMARALRQLAAAYQEKGEYDRADDSYRAAERLLGQCDDETELAELHLQMGSLYEDRGQYRKAREVYQRSLIAYEHTHNLLGTAVCQRHMASVLRATGRLVEAHQLLTDAVETLKQYAGSGKPELMEVHILLGQVQRDEGRLDEAIQSYQLAMDIAETISSLPGQAACLQGTGNTYTRQGEYSEAIRALEQALSIASDLKDTVALAEIHADLGDAHEARSEPGDLEAAIARYKQSLRISRRLERNPSTVRALVMLARTYRLVGRYDLAEECVVEAEELIEHLDGREWQIRLHLERARLGLAAHRGRSVPDEAARHLRRALSLFPAEEQGALSLECHEVMVDISLRQGNIETAIEHLNRLARGRSPGPVSTWRHLLTELHPGLDEAAGKLFADGRNEEAVRAAFRLYEDRLRKLVRVRTARADIPQLIKMALDRREDFFPWESREELAYFQKFSESAYAAFRNPVSHHQFPLTGTEAFCVLAVVHLMLTFLLSPADVRMES